MTVYLKFPDEATFAASMPTVDRARLGHNQAGSYLNGHLHTWDAYRRAVPVRERLELTA